MRRDGGREVAGGCGNPREDWRGLAGDPGLVESAAQGEGLGELGDAQPVGAALKGCERDRDQAVPVGVCLDGGELKRVGGGCAQDAQVVADRCQVDGRG